MGIRLPTFVLHAKQILKPRSPHNQYSSSPVATTLDAPKGHFAVYVGEKEKNRFVVPLSYLKHPLFQDLLRKAEEEYGFDHPMGGLTIPCSEDAFLNVASHLSHHY
ncbi:Indole-3-acetic acid-induced protein ARG7 [Camellia lanceoleosa]|uniref:Indole-3-acetic acid-induced protein ARG7 n=1 Tax=Camellia lanceoleosa TaxID=1840588 RepID=A0ACC0I5M2_9ERIC|nr:Indole-3-acetic acid-induced protein ARG7 [Camellia lanceoleosa]